MKHIHLFAATAALAAAFSSGAAIAQAFAPAQAKGFTAELGISHHQEAYEEFAKGSGEKLMRETAPMLGVKGSIAHAVGAYGQVKATAEYAFGDGTYTGARQGGSYGDVRASGLRRMLVESTVSYRHAQPNWAGVAFKGGLGFRHLVDNLQDAGEGGYKRTNQRLYAILGLERPFSAGAWWATPSLEYKHSLWSRNKSDLEGGITHRQHGNGHELSVAFSQKAGTAPVTIRPFYRAWNIAHSSESKGSYEPKNKTTELGLDLSWRF